MESAPRTNWTFRRTYRRLEPASTACFGDSGIATTSASSMTDQSPACSPATTTKRLFIGGANTFGTITSAIFKITVQPTKDHT